MITNPLDLNAIEARALAAPGGEWAEFPDGIWIPFTDVVNDDEHYGRSWDSGRIVRIDEQHWHTQGADPDGLWPFLATVRPDVLALVREVRRLRTEAMQLRAKLTTADTRRAVAVAS
jgi:hypothetical protein